MERDALLNPAMRSVIFVRQLLMNGFEICFETKNSYDWYAYGKDLAFATSKKKILYKKRKQLE